MQSDAVERCYAVVGAAGFGPMYCGNRAKMKDVNGRPVCGVHKKGNPTIAWYGDRYRYPEGTGGRWRFLRGEFRGESGLGPGKVSTGIAETEFRRDCPCPACVDHYEGRGDAGAD